MLFDDAAFQLLLQIDQSEILFLFLLLYQKVEMVIVILFVEKRVQKQEVPKQNVCGFHLEKKEKGLAEKQEKKEKKLEKMELGLVLDDSGHSC